MHRKIFTPFFTVTLIIALALVISFVPNKQEAFAAEKEPGIVEWFDVFSDSFINKVLLDWGNSKHAKKYEVRVKGPDKFWHKYKVVKKTKKNKKKYTVKGKYKVKKKGKKKYQVYKYGVAYKSYFTKKKWMDLPLKEGKKYYIKVRGINKKKKGKFSKVEVIIPDYTDLEEDDADAGFDGDYYIDEDY